MLQKNPLTDAASNKIRNMSIFCAFLVVIIHCRPCFACGTAGWWMAEILENGIAQIAVPFFFTVSGYMVARSLSNMGYSKAVYKRIRTLCIPFFIWNALFWIELNMMANFGKTASGKSFSFEIPSFEQIGIWPTECPLLSPLWYVRAIFVLTLLSPIAVFCVKKFRWIFLMLSFAVYGVTCPFWPVPNAGAFEVFARVGMLPVLGIFYFSVGIALYEGIVDIKTIRRIPDPAICLVSGIVLAVFRAVIVQNGWGGGHYVGFVLVPLVLYGVWGVISEKAWPTFLAFNSFGVYVLHKFIMVPLRVVFNPGAGTGAYILFALVGFAGSIALVSFGRKIFPRMTAFVFGGR